MNVLKMNLVHMMDRGQIHMFLHSRSLLHVIEATREKWNCDESGGKERRQREVRLLKGKSEMTEVLALSGVQGSRWRRMNRNCGALWLYSDSHQSLATSP